MRHIFWFLPAVFSENRWVAGLLGFLAFLGIGLGVQMIWFSTGEHDRGYAIFFLVLVFFSYVVLGFWDRYWTKRTG